MDRPFPNIFSAQAAQAAQPPGEDEWVSGLRCQISPKIQMDDFAIFRGLEDEFSVNIGCFQGLWKKNRG